MVSTMGLEKEEIKDLTNAVTSMTLDQAKGQEVRKIWNESDLASLLPVKTKLEKLDRHKAGVEILDRADMQSLIEAEIVAARLLTSKDAVKRVWHMELETSKLDNYFPGDSFGMLVENKSGEVENVLSRLFPPADESMMYVVHSESETDAREKNSEIVGTARTLLSTLVDLRAPPRKTLIRALATHCSEAADEDMLLSLCSRAGRSDYKKLIFEDSIGFLGLLGMASSCRPPLELLLDQLPALTPRWYSAASASEVDGSVIHFAFSVVKNGLATEMLEKACLKFLDTNQQPAQKIRIIPRKTIGAPPFRPPKNLGTNYLMIGPGTGVSPFRGFLRQREKLLADNKYAEGIGKVVLFSGCRHKTRDFLYGSEFEDYEKRNILGKLHVAFSRDGPVKVYVQDKILDASDMVARMILKEDATVYLCGDGGAMASGVDKVLAEIIARHAFSGNVSEAKSYLKKMTKMGRYRKDIWFWG